MKCLFALFIFCISCVQHRTPIDNPEKCRKINPKQYCITTEFSGGRLGNQLFEVATALSLAKDNHCTAIFPMFTERSSWKSMATYSVNPESLFASYLNDKEDAIFSKRRLGNSRDEGSLACFQNILEENPSISRKEYIQEVYSKLPVILQGSGWKTMFQYYWFRNPEWGYFKFWSYKFFENHKSYIQDTLGPSQKQHQKLLEKFEKLGLSLNKNTCSIHLRRGDRKGIFWRLVYPTAKLSYYKKAINKMNIITKERKTPIDIFVVFSDEPEYAKNFFLKNFPKEKFFFVDSKKQKDYEDLWLMSMAKHNIIMNSTFSFWGAYLNKNPNKIVIQPEKWLGLSHSSYEISPPDWIAIP